MDAKKLLKLIVFLMFFIFFFDIVVQKFHWDYSIWWIDMLLHFLGGVWVGLFFVYVFYVRSPILEQILYVILLVFMIGVFWELVELYIYSYVGHDTFDALDSMSDIFFDLTGGTFATLYYLKKIMVQSQ